MAIRVLLVGRHEALLEGLRAQLSCDSDFIVHAHAIGIPQAEAWLRSSEADVVVVDGDCSMDAVLIFARLVRSVQPSCGFLLIESTQIEPWRDADLTDLLSGLIGRQDLPHCLPEAVRAIRGDAVYLSPEVRSHAVHTECGLRYLPQSSAFSASTQPMPAIEEVGAERADVRRRSPNLIEPNCHPDQDGLTPPARYNGGVAMSLGGGSTRPNASAMCERFREKAARRAAAFHPSRPPIAAWLRRL